jgi:hypothetical protein
VGILDNWLVDDADPVDSVELPDGDPTDKNQLFLALPVSAGVS